jgi:DNA-binding MarR family transcriptional regulator
MNKKAIERLSNAVTALRANEFETLAEAAVFCAAATATAGGRIIGVTDIQRATKLPLTTVSRLIRAMNQRGLLEYMTIPKDRRARLVRAKLEAFKSPVTGF